jgi:hypothetical protein
MEVLPRLPVLVHVQAQTTLEFHFPHPHEVVDVIRSQLEQGLPVRLVPLAGHLPLDDALADEHGRDRQLKGVTDLDAKAPTQAHLSSEFDSRRGAVHSPREPPYRRFSADSVSRRLAGSSGRAGLTLEEVDD